MSHTESKCALFPTHLVDTKLWLKSICPDECCEEDTWGDSSVYHFSFQRLHFGDYSGSPGPLFIPTCSIGTQSSRHQVSRLFQQDTHYCLSLLVPTPDKAGTSKCFVRVGDPPSKAMHQGQTRHQTRTDAKTHSRVTATAQSTCLVSAGCLSVPQCPYQYKGE